MKRLSSRKRLIGVGAALIAAITFAAGFVANSERNEKLQFYRSATANLANNLAPSTSRFFAGADLALRQVRDKVVFKPGMSASQLADALRRKPFLDFMAERQIGERAVSKFTVYGADGTLASSTPGPAPRQADREMMHFLESGTDASLFIAVPGTMAQPAAGTMLLARRLTSPRGGFAGVVAAIIPLSYLETYYAAQMPQWSSVALIRRDGVMMLHYPGHAMEAGRKIPVGSSWYSLAPSGASIAEPTGYFDTTPLLAAIRPVDGMPLVVGASIDMSVVLAGWYRQRMALIAGSIYASICVVLLLRLIADQLRLLEEQHRSLGGNVAALQISNVHLDVARRHLDVVFSNISQGLCLFSANHRLIVCNNRYREIYHLPPGAGEPGVTLEEIVNHCYAAGGIAQFARADLLASFLTTARSGETRQSLLEMRDGRTIAIRQQPMRDGGWVATHEDITERRQSETKIAYLARHDVLTGLPNRALFEEQIELAIGAAARGAMFAVLFLDLDRFKAVNDTLGHQAGDTLLRTVATRLRGTVREIDTVARLGGDEFVILQLGLDVPADAAQLAQRIIEVIGAPYSIGDDTAEIGVSIGVEISTPEVLSAETLIKNADMALYIAKSEGRGVYRFFEPEMDANAQNRYALERDLRLALDHGEFEMYYQPIVDLRSRRICTYEGLLRWHHPARGLLQPRDFMEAAEDSGLIVPIGTWVIGQVCRQAAGWSPDINVAVNLSHVQFRASPLLAIITEALAESGLTASRLEVEIAEPVLLASNEATYAVLHGVRALGVGVTMDDFGIGYSSLSYLRQFPFDKIKIDQSFVADLTKRDDALFIVRAIAGLCRNMGIRTTVEGIETAAQLEIATGEGCTEAQGYYFGAPKPARHLADLQGSKEALRF